MHSRQAAPAGATVSVLAASKSYREVAALRSVSLRFEPGAINVLVGPSGCGKTTLLRCLNRLEELDSGEILVRGANIAAVDPVALRRSIGYVIQEVGLFPHQNVFDNVAAVPRLLGWEPARIERRVRELLELVRLRAEHSNRFPHELSGGERQRVGFARALCADPDIVLMDEPFGAIDPINRRALQDWLLDTQAELRKTIILVTHDMDEALRLGEQIIVMDQGRVEFAGTPRELLSDQGGPLAQRLLGAERPIRALAFRLVRDHMDPVAETRVGEPAAPGASAQSEAHKIRIDDGATLQQALARMLETGRHSLDVVDRQGRLRGTLALGALLEVTRPPLNPGGS